jgi:hypothetical protein
MIQPQECGPAELSHPGLDERHLDRNDREH